VTTSFADRAARLGVEITQDIQLPGEVFTDRIQLQMVLHNLLANALDALEDVAGERRVHITVAMEGGRLRAVIEDSGHGVLPEIRGQLFEPFITHKSDGMGLGLAIARSLLRSQGGELRLDPSGSRGARFLMDIPIGATESEP
jgi:C4-dicarboxylate-specific signal transduction histidine kinase